jgi:hypothetical protein
MIRVVHPGSRIRMLTFYPSRISDPGSRGQKGTGSRIRIRNTAGKYKSGGLPWTVLMQCRPDVPFLALTTLSVEERNMYFLAATVTPDCARLSVLLYFPSRLFSSSTDTWHEKKLRKFIDFKQCCGSGSESGSTCFWASWIRIHEQKRYGSGSCFGSGSFYHQAKTARKTFIHTYCL